MTTPTKEDIERAKEIVGKWGYEEPYWWEPIALALADEKERTLKAARVAARRKELSRARLEGKAEGAQEVCSELNRTYFFNGNRNDMKMTANHVKDHIVAESYALKKILDRR